MGFIKFILFFMLCLAFFLGVHYCLISFNILKYPTTGLIFSVVMAFVSAVQLYDQSKKSKRPPK